MEIECFRYTPINKSSCLGIANIYISDWDLEIYGLTLHQKDGKKWVNFPTRSYEKDGIKKYATYFRFKETEHYTNFCTKAKEAIEKFINEHPLDDEEIPF